MQRIFSTLSGNLCIGLLYWLSLTFQTALAQEEVHIQSENIKFTLAVPKADYQREEEEEEVQLEFTLSNVGATPVMIQSWSGQLFDFAVYDAQGSLLKKPSFVQKPLLTPPHPQILQPNQSLSIKVPWNLTLSDHEKPTPLPAGRYALQGFMNQSANQPPFKKWSFDGQDSSSQLMTPLLYITVR